MNCIFCKIANGEISSHKLYEDDHVVAILDLSPVSTGHTLIIPKHHADNILFCEEKVINSIGKAIQIVGKALLKSGAQGINVLSNVNESAGQSVMHAHVHLIPVDEEGRKLVLSFPGIKEDLSEVCSKLKNYIEKE